MYIYVKGDLSFNVQTDLSCNHDLKQSTYI